MQINEGCRAIFEAMTEGILIIDDRADIVYANRAYLTFLGMELGEIAGRPLRKVRANARLPEVLKGEGQPILHAARKEESEIYFVNMYPIKENGNTVGGVSVVTFLEDAYGAKAELEAYEKRSRQILQSISRASGTRHTFWDICAADPASLAVKAIAQRAAETDITVLLESESGTGKELYAQAIHNASERRNEPFVAINCSNFNTQMLESELFGYVEGAFTGAKKGGKLGLFEATGGGTLFLDEISEMETGLQAKLLRVLQERRIRPVGGLKEIDIDVRIICACNADLAKRVEEGSFRRDLYYRINVFRIIIPPLRERRQDIPLLADEILAELSQKLHRKICIEPEAAACLMNYEWPGNVRELRNVLEFSACMCDGTIRKSTLPEIIRYRGENEEAVSSLAERVKRFERKEIEKALSRCGDDLEGKKKAAKELGISLASLYNKLKIEIE